MIGIDFYGNQFQSQLVDVLIQELPDLPAKNRLETLQLPETWGNDSLTSFLKKLECNSIASFVVLPICFDPLIRIDQSVIEKAHDIFQDIPLSKNTSAQLFMRSFSTYRAAVRLVVSGQLFEAYVLMRSLLESAVYAWVCCESEQHRQAWKTRAKGDPERISARKNFSWASLIKKLEVSNGQLSSQISQEYERLIDYGAHPNVEGVALSTELRRLNGSAVEMNTLFAHGREGILLGTLSLIRCMDYVIQLFFMVLGDRLIDLDLYLGIQNTCHSIRDSLPKIETELKQQLTKDIMSKT